MAPDVPYISSPAFRSNLDRFAFGETALADTLFSGDNVRNLVKLLTIVVAGPLTSSLPSGAR